MMTATYYIEVPKKLKVNEIEMMMELEKDAFPGLGAVDEQCLVPLTRYGKMVWFKEKGDDRPIAVGELMRNFDNPDEAYVFGYYVRSDQQGKGIGKKFLVELLDYIQQQGFHYVTLTVNIENLAAIKLYEAFGFEIVETRENEFGKDEHRYCMKKKF